MEQFIINGTYVVIKEGDITREKVDAVVNAANSSLMGGGGVDGAIHRAGGNAILEECKKIVASQGRLPAGKAVITTGGNLPAKYVIHTVGPVWHGGKYGEAETLAGCYTECLNIAVSNNLKSIAFPAISAGAYGYPVDLATKVAVNTVIDFIKKNTKLLNKVSFILYDDNTYKIYLNEIRSVY